MRYRIRFFSISGKEYIPTTKWGRDIIYGNWRLSKSVMIHLDYMTLEKFNFWGWKWEEIERYKFKR